MGGASTGGSDTSDEKKQDTYSTQFKKNYKVKKDGTVKKKNVVERYVENSFLTNNPLSDYTEKVNRKYFEETVKPAGKSKYDTYEDYIRARGRGEVDAYGREITNTGGNDNNNQPILTSAAETLPANNMTATAPTNAEITQASSTNMSGDEILLANKKKGRSETILNQAQGLGDSTANTTKKKLGA